MSSIYLCQYMIFMCIFVVIIVEYVSLFFMMNEYFSKHAGDWGTMGGPSGCVYYLLLINIKIKVNESIAHTRESLHHCHRIL